jgi:hypothetical protein
MNEMKFDSDSVSELLKPGAAMAQAYERVGQRLAAAARAGVAARAVPPAHGAHVIGDRRTRCRAATRSRGIDRSNAAVLAGSYTRDDRLSPPSARRSSSPRSTRWTPRRSPTIARGVVAHFGEPGLVALIEALGFIDGRIRLARMLGPLLDRGTHHA